MTHLVVTLPLKIESTANLREHWARRASRAVRHRNTACMALLDARLHQWRDLDMRHIKNTHIEPPCVVTMTRIAPRELDSDNLAISFKSVRDGIADWLGVNDNDKRIEWKYAQERGAPKHYAARIEIQAAVSRMDARTQAGASESQPQGATE